MARIKLDGTRPVETRYKRDLLGRVKEVRDPLQNRWLYGYDLLGNRISVNDPDLGNWSSSFDDASRVITQTDAKGTVTSLSYDAMGRVLGKTVSSSNNDRSEFTSFVYDEARAGFANRGKLTTATRVVGTQSIGSLTILPVNVSQYRKEGNKSQPVLMAVLELSFPHCNGYLHQFKSWLKSRCAVRNAATGSSCAAPMSCAGIRKALGSVISLL